jgi:hypothetical protein
MTDISLVSADNLEGSVELSSPVLSLKDIQQKIVQWVEKQDSFWPDDLTAEMLTMNLQEVYVAHWVLTCEADGLWAASIGTDHNEPVRCSGCVGRGWNRYGPNDKRVCTDCAGTGQTLRKKTFWATQSGGANASINGKVVENVADNTPIRCGKRDLNASGKLLTKPFPSNVLVLRPESTDDDTGIKLAQEYARIRLENDANSQASSLGRVRNLRVTNINTANVKAFTWLYPIYAGKYIYNEKSYLIEIDGITGKLSVPQPAGVIAKRVAVWIAVIATIVAVISGLWFLVDWLIYR